MKNITLILSLCLFAFNSFSSLNKVGYDILLDKTSTPRELTSQQTGQLTNKTELDLSLYSLSLNDFLQNKAKYQYRVKKVKDPGHEHYTRVDYYSLGLTLDGGNNSRFAFFKSSIWQGIEVKRRFEDRDSAYKSLPYNPLKLPLKAQSLIETNVGDRFKLPTHTSVGIELSPYKLFGLFETRAIGYFVYQGLIEIDIERISQKKLRFSIRTGKGTKIGNELRLSLFTPQIIFSILNHDIDKVFDLKLIQKKTLFNKIGGKLIDIEFDLDNVSSLECYENFFNDFYSLRSKKIPGSSSFKSFYHLLSYSSDRGAFVRYNHNYELQRSVKDIKLNPLALIYKKSKKVRHLTIGKKSILSYKREFSLNSRVDKLIADERNSTSVDMIVNKEGYRGRVQIQYHDQFMTYQNKRFINSIRKVYNDMFFDVERVGAYHRGAKASLKLDIDFEKSTLDKAKYTFEDIYHSLKSMNPRELNTIIGDDQKPLVKKKIGFEVKRLEEIFKKLQLRSISKADLIFLRKSRAFQLLLPEYLRQNNFIIGLRADLGNEISVENGQSLKHDELNYLKSLYEF